MTFYTVPTGDPILPVAVQVKQLIDPRIRALVLPGEITLQSQSRPSGTPSWAWGYTRGAKCWVNPSHPYVEEEYTVAHETAHALENLLFTPELRAAILGRMKGLSAGQTWKGGTYTANSCSVPYEGFADAFAKAIGAGAFVKVLPHFFKTYIDPADYLWLISTIVTMAVHK